MKKQIIIEDYVIGVLTDQKNKLIGGLDHIVKTDILGHEFNEDMQVVLKRISEVEEAINILTLI